TTASDGTLSPRELVLAAARHGVAVLGVTGHDSTDGLADAMALAPSHPMAVVPGLGSNCDGEGAEIHGPGDFVDDEDGWIPDFLREQRAERIAGVHRIAERLAELGMPIEPAEVFAVCKEGSPGRPHVAQVMVARGYVKSVREAFDKYLKQGGAANVPR